MAASHHRVIVSRQNNHTCCNLSLHAFNYSTRILDWVYQALRQEVDRRKLPVVSSKFEEATRLTPCRLVVLIYRFKYTITRLIRRQAAPDSLHSQILFILTFLTFQDGASVVSTSQLRSKFRPRRSAEKLQ
jgi:hypothetical protein